jgi:hypothetical protein
MPSTRSPRKDATKSVSSCGVSVVRPIEPRRPRPCATRWVDSQEGPCLPGGTLRWVRRQPTVRVGGSCRCAATSVSVHVFVSMQMQMQMQIGVCWTTHDGMVRVAESGRRDFVVSRERIWGEELAAASVQCPAVIHRSICLLPPLPPPHEDSPRRHCPPVASIANGSSRSRERQR